MTFQPVSLDPSPGFHPGAAPSRPKRRGGPRPGAGAPRGNLNALKHGLRSTQFAQLGAILATIPETRAVLLAIARRHQLKQRRAEEVAALLLARVVQRGVQIGNVRLNATPPVHERRSIKDNPRPQPLPQIRPVRSKTSRPPEQSTAKAARSRTNNKQTRKTP